MPIRHRIEIEALGIKTRIRVDLHPKPPSGYFAVLRTTDGQRLSTIFGDFNQEKAMKVGEAGAKTFRCVMSKSTDRK